VMCKTHWTQYIRALRRAKIAREGEAVRAHNEAMEKRTTPASGSLDAISNQQRRAQVQAAGKVPAADGSVPGESDQRRPSRKRRPPRARARRR
jgi:hypothetical protein